jgi:hypothetical protein
MRKFRPWIIGLGILAVIAVICANIYDSMLEKEDLKDEPAWVEPDTTAVDTLVVND